MGRSITTVTFASAPYGSKWRASQCDLKVKNKPLIYLIS
jgi:hypothetical protein